MFKKCIKEENVGRSKFIELAQQNGINDISPTIEYFDPIDLIYTTKSGIRVAVEIKNRDPKYEKYSTYLMELNKYKGMKKRMEEEGCQLGLYAYFFGDHAYLYNIETIFKHKILYQSNVHANSYNDQTTVKTMMEFDKRLNIGVYYKQDGRWTKQ